jgi:hypothetical protein
MIIKSISIINNIKTTVTIKALNPLKRRLLITSEYVKMIIPVINATTSSLNMLLSSPY